MVIDIDIDKLKFLLNMTDVQIGEQIDSVLSDSRTDPHHSAVYAKNMIKCYIQIMKELGSELPYKDAESFFLFNAYTSEEYAEFEALYKKEAEYYIGEIY